MRKAVGRQRYYGQNRAAGDMISFDAVWPIFTGKQKLLDVMILGSTKLK